MADLKSILDPVQVPNPVKAAAWDAFNGSSTPEEFRAHFDQISLPQETKAQLWDAKFGGQAAAPAAQKPDGPLSTLWNETVVNPLHQVGAAVEGAGASANRLTANTFHLLDQAADTVSKITGMPKGGAFQAISDWARKNQGAQEKTAQDLSGGRTDFPSQVIRGGTQGVLELPQYAVAGHVMGPTAGLAAVGAIRESDQGWQAAVTAAAEGALLGKALEVMGPASRKIRLTGAAAMTYAQARIKGADNATALANATTMGLMAGQKPGGMTAREMLPTGDQVAAKIGDWAAPRVRSSLNPKQQAAVDYVNKEEGVPLPASALTGNRYIRSVEALTKNSPLGSVQASDFGRSTEEGMTGLGRKLAQQISPEKPETPESAGRAPGQELRGRIADLDVQEDTAYGDAWAHRDDPQHTHKLPVRMTEEPVLDDEGKPTGQMRQVPTYANVNMPIDITGIKAKAQPIVDEMQWIPVSERNSSVGYTALKRIIEGDDYIPAWQAERGLSGLKSLAREADSPNLRNFSQGIAAGIIPDLQNGINDAVALTGDEAIRGLQSGRALHASKMELGDLQKQLRDEPVQAFGQLTWQKDAGIDFLRRIAEEAPSAPPKIGRALVDQLIDQATQKGGFNRAEKLFGTWFNMGDQTKAILVPDPKLRSSLDKFFLAGSMVAENPNPSGTALVEAAKSMNVVRWAAGHVGGKLLFTPEGIDRLTKNFKALPRRAAPPNSGNPNPPAPANGGGGGPLASAGAQREANRQAFVNQAKAAGRPSTDSSQSPIAKSGADATVTPGVDDARNETPAVQSGRTGEGPADSGPDRTIQAADPGASATSVRIPGSDRAYSAAYKVKELADVRPSHSGITFNPNPKYALRNDRNYSAPENQRKVIDWSGPQFDPRYHITDNPDASNGPPVIDEEGHVLGGNGRSMILERVYASNPKGAQAYRALLMQKAAQYGIDPQQIGGMKQPVLVREIPDTEGLDSGSKQRAITDFNKKDTAELKPSEKAIADSRGVSQETLNDIASRLEHKGPDATLAEILEGRGGAEVLQKLIGDGVVSPQESAAYIHNNVLTADGKTRISKLMMGRFFQDPEMLDRTPASIRNKLERITALLAKVEGNPEWSLSKHLQDALGLLEEANAHGAKNLDDFVHQSGLFGSQNYSPESIALAKQLRSAVPTELTKAVRQYTQDARFAAEGSGLFADPLTPREAFETAFGQLGK